MNRSLTVVLSVRPRHQRQALNHPESSVAWFHRPECRYADLITQRLLKSAIAGRSAPYSYAELEALAGHLTEEEDAANKVERQVGKSAAALLLESRIGEQFDAIVTGASDKGTWVRLLTVPVDVERGYIDF